MSIHDPHDAHKLDFTDAGNNLAPAVDENVPLDTEINLSDYVDHNVEAILLSAAAAGDPAKIEAYKAELSREEQCGWCEILLMRDDLAVVRWHDQFVLTLTAPSLATVMGGS